MLVIYLKMQYLFTIFSFLYQTWFDFPLSLTEIFSSRTENSLQPYEAKRKRIDTNCSSIFIMSNVLYQTRITCQRSFFLPGTWDGGRIVQKQRLKHNAQRRQVICSISCSCHVLDNGCDPNLSDIKVHISHCLKHQSLNGNLNKTQCCSRSSVEYLIYL